MPAPQLRRPDVPWEMLLRAKHELSAGATYQRVISELTASFKGRPHGGRTIGIVDVRNAASWVLQARHGGETLTENIFNGRNRGAVLPFNPNQPRQYQLVVGAKVHYGRGVRIKDVWITMNADTLPTAAEIMRALNTAISHGQEHYGERPATLIDGYTIGEAYAG